MKIWVDADACPKLVKSVLFKAAERVQIELILVANHAMSFPNSKFISLQIVAQGFDVADDHIASQILAGDVLVTQDIPLAAEAVEKDAFVLGPRGEVYTQENIKQRLQVRDMMETLRNAGQLDGGGPPAYTPSDQQKFANALDRLLTRQLKSS